MQPEKIGTIITRKSKKMNKIAFTKRIALTLFALFMSTMMWAQSLTGEGTEDNPYLISSAEDWNTFASSSDYWASGVCVRLDADIEVSTMVGTSSNNYSGTFDGNWHTLTFNNGTVANPCTVEKCAPFSFVGPGTTIKNLTVEGTIISEKKFAAGLIGWLEGSGTYHITNCTSNITINCSKIEKGTNSSKYWDCSTGGFIGQIESGTVYFTNCVFSGSILKDTQPSANRCAGFVSYNGGNITYTNCTMAGTIEMANNYSTFNRNARNSFNRAYYINDYGDVPTTGCEQALTTAPNDDIAKIYTDYYVPGAEISGLETTTYSYVENEPVEIVPVVTYYGQTLTRGTDYIIKINGTEVSTGTTPTLSNAGDYIFTIEGKTGSSYAGSQTTTIHVVSYNTWAALQEVLADASQGDRNITLSADISPENPSGEDVALVVDGTVVLNLNNHTIDRNLYTANPQAEPVVKGQVIRVSSGANLTINGGGTIKGGYNYAYENDIDGGGIYNMGNLVLNNVNVEHNGCTKGNFGSESNTARGGGIYTGNGSSLTINGGSISENKSGGGGGGIYNYKANTFSMDNVSVTFNESGSKGGGIRIDNSGKTASIKSCTISANKVTESASNGGGIHMEKGTLYMEDCSIIYNSSRQQGCGIYQISGTTNAKNCHFDHNSNINELNDNTTENKGGGISVYAGTFTMDGGTVTGNSCNNNGGAIYVRNGAYFKVKGDVQIVDNTLVQFVLGAPAVVNNAYLESSASIEVIGELGEHAIITITPLSSHTSTYVTFAEGVSTTNALSHFALDNDEYRLILVDNHIEAYELYPWNETSTWNGTIATDLNGELPTASSEVTINRAVKIPSGCRAEANTITLGDYGEIVIKNGGQLIHSNAVTTTLQKNISAYTVLANNDVDKTNGWYTITSPVTGNSSTESVTIGDYDLYLYNEPTHYWWNAKDGSGHGFSTLSNGRGYLYANKKDVTLNFTGTTQATTSANVSVPLSYTDNAGNLKGYNLVGNPFTRNLTSSDAIMVGGSPLTTYIYVSNGSEMITTTLTERPIQPGEGFFVQATGAGQNLVFNYEAPTSDGISNVPAFLRIEAGDDNFMDRAYVKFGDGNTLHKITINDNVPHVSVQQGKDDLASATIKATQGEMPVHFKAAKNCSYSITVSPEGMEMDYLHLIDNLTGADIDLLSTPTYTFTARNNDYVSRFRLVYSARHSSGSNTNNESFAFIANGRIILTGVENNATLQVIDVTGRIIHQGDATDCVSTSELVSGVYVLRLIQNSDAKTQKIVVD